MSRKYFLSKVTIDDLKFIDWYNTNIGKLPSNWEKRYSPYVSNMYIYVSNFHGRFTYNFIDDHIGFEYESLIPTDNIIDLLLKDCPKAYENYLRCSSKLGHLL